MAFDKLTIVFGCSIAADSMSTVSSVSAVSACFVIDLDCFLGFDNLEAVFGCPTVTHFVSLLFGFSIVFASLLFFYRFLKNKS